MPNPITLNELTILSNLTDLKFTLYTEVYNTNLLDLNIDLAKEWLNKQSVHPKRQIERYNLLSQWVMLATKYKRLIELFYPTTVSRVKDYIIELKKSGYLISYDISTLKDYWLTTIQTNSSKSFRDLIDLSRIASKLELKENKDLIRFGELFDTEKNFGYSSEAFESFSFLLLYLDKAATEPNWGYTKYEWPLLKKSLSLWRTWQLGLTTSCEEVELLLQKYLNISHIHPFFRERIWRSSNPELDEYSPWFIETNYSLITQDKTSKALKVLGLPNNVDYVIAKEKYKTLIKKYHPDTPNGHLDKAQEINEAWAEIKKLYETYDSK